MMTMTLLRALSSKAGHCARLERENAGLQDDLCDVLLRYNHLMAAYSKLLNECMQSEERITP